MSRKHHRPLLPGADAINSIVGGDSPHTLHEIAEKAAEILVRGANSTNSDLAERVIKLADNEGIDTLAHLWADAPVDSIAGCLWRLYALRESIHLNPIQAAREFEAGSSHAPVDLAISGAVIPPHPAQMMALIDEVLAGIVTSDFADVLFRAAAFSRVIAIGRLNAPLDYQTRNSANRLLQTAQQLEAAGWQETDCPLS